MANLLTLLFILLPSLAWGMPGLMPPAEIPAGGGGGAFPVVAAVTTSTQTANASNHAHVIPSGSSGDLIVMGCAIDAAPVVTPASGWTALINLAAPANTNKGYIQYRVADGSEVVTPTTFTAFTTTTDGSTAQTERSACVSYRITGQRSASFIEAASANAVSTNLPDPPSMTASWGAVNNLWLAFASSDDNMAFTGMPSGFAAKDTGGDTLDKAATGNTTAGAEVIGAYKQDAVATLNPGTFSVGGNIFENSAFTVVIRPVD